MDSAWARAGGICVPLSTRLTASEVGRFARLVAVRWAITDQRDLVLDAGLEVWEMESLPRHSSGLPD